MPLFVVYPAKPNILECMLEVLGKPENLEVGVLVRDERFKELFKPNNVERFTIQYSCKPKTERVLELYREYYKSYTDTVEKVKAQTKESLRTISHFKAKWYVDGLSVEFDGFKLKMNVWTNINKAIELIQIFKEKIINIEIDLSCKEV
jgi:hypothetical protein